MWSVCSVEAAIAVLVVAALAHGDSPPLLCRHEQCRYLGRNGEYEVDGKNISFEFIQPYTHISLDCRGADVLESAALPRAEATMRVSSVRWARCPLPAHGSLADMLAAINVVLNDDDRPDPWYSSLILTLFELPSMPPLAANHFTGLERITNLRINGHSKSTPEHGFLAPLQHLRRLEMRDVMLSDFEWDASPPALEVVTLSNTNLKRLPDSLRILPTLHRIKMSQDGPLDAVGSTLGGGELSLGGNPTTFQLDTTQQVESLTLFHWTEQWPVPLTSCFSLRKLHLEQPAIVALPDGWLAKCSRLTVLQIEQARHLTALPPQMLLGASALVEFAVRRGVLETLPAGLLDYTPDLHTISLDYNRLRTLPSGLFDIARKVGGLNLSFNQLTVDVLEALTPLQGPNELRLYLDDNQSLRNAGLCDPRHNGSLPLRMMNLTFQFSCFWKRAARSIPKSNSSAHLSASFATNAVVYFTALYLIARCWK